MENEQIAEELARNMVEQGFIFFWTGSFIRSGEFMKIVKEMKVKNN